MINFSVLKQSVISRARLGILKTPHGEVETPAFVAVATRASVKTISSEEAARAGCQLLIANTYHLHLRPGESTVRKAGGLHKFMNWGGPLMTDSAGFQVFSLGFGLDHGVGKLAKPSKRGHTRKIKLATQPKKIKITPDGVYFRSVIDGRELFIGPKESICIQEALGADIMLAFDECTSPLADKEYVADSLQRTHRWAKQSLKARRTKQALYGITQGSHYKDLRIQSAKYINSLGFDGFAIGGDFGDEKRAMEMVLKWTVPNLDPCKPRHFLGIGYPEDIERIVKNGVDTFDCTVPTHFGRHGVAFTTQGRLNMKQTTFLKDKKTLENKCGCETCQNNYGRNYISHLIRAGELTGLKLLTVHNLFHFNGLVAAVRRKISRELI